jgi:hypothetical protein
MVDGKGYKKQLSVEWGEPRTLFQGLTAILKLFYF